MDSRDKGRRAVRVPGALPTVLLCGAAWVGAVGCDRGMDLRGDAPDVGIEMGDTVEERDDGSEGDLVDDGIDAPPPDGACVPTTSLSFVLLRPFFEASAHVVDESAGMLLAVPRWLGASTRYLLGISLDPGRGEQVSLPVAGDWPVGVVLSVVHDPAARRTLAFGPAYRPGDSEYVGPLETTSLVLEGGEAFVTHLAGSGAPDYLPHDVFPEGDGVHYRAVSQQHTVRGTVSGDAIAWDPIVTLGSASSEVHGVALAHDRPGSRILAYGERYVEGYHPYEREWMQPSMFALDWPGGSGWTRLATSGEAPPQVGFSLPPGVLSVFHDDPGARLVVLLYADGAHGLWSLSDAAAWTRLVPDLGLTRLPSLLVQDPGRHRAILFQDDSLETMDLTSGREGDRMPLDAGAPAAPRTLAAAFDTRRGRLLAGAQTGLISMAVRDGDFVWREVPGGGPLPDRTEYGHSLTYDPATDRVILFGGCDTTYRENTGAAYTFDFGAPTPAWVPVVMSGDGMLPRRGHRAIADPEHRLLYVVGGYTGTTNSPQVYAVNLDTFERRYIARLPTGRSYPVLHMSADGTHLFVLGGVVGDAGYTFLVDLLRDAYRVDTATGAVQPLTVVGDFPASYDRTVPTGLDLPSGFILLWGEDKAVRVTRTALSDAEVRYTDEMSCEPGVDFVSGEGFFDAATGHGYVAGRSLSNIPGFGGAVWKVTE